VKPNSKQMS